MSKRLLGLIMSYEKGINKQGCPLLVHFGHDVFVFSMIVCELDESLWSKFTTAMGEGNHF